MICSGGKETIYSKMVSRLDFMAFLTIKKLGKVLGKCDHVSTRMSMFL